MSKQHLEVLALGDLVPHHIGGSRCLNCKINPSATLNGIPLTGEDALLPENTRLLFEGVELFPVGTRERLMGIQCCNEPEVRGCVYQFIHKEATP